MQALVKGLDLLNLPTPAGTTLYGAYTHRRSHYERGIFFFSRCRVTRAFRFRRGAVGVAAGCGAVVLPPPLGLAAQLMKRTTFMRAMSIALYAVGVLAAGYAQRALRAIDGRPPRVIRRIARAANPQGDVDQVRAVDRGDSRSHRYYGIPAPRFDVAARTIPILERVSDRLYVELALPGSRTAGSDSRYVADRDRNPHRVLYFFQLQEAYRHVRSHG
jgi:hypothetical protein